MTYGKHFFQKQRNTGGSSMKEKQSCAALQALQRTVYILFPPHTFVDLLINKTHSPLLGITLAEHKNNTENAM